MIESFAKYQILQKKMVEIFLWITNPRNEFETILVFGRYFYINSFDSVAVTAAPVIGNISAIAIKILSHKYFKTIIC